MKADICIEICKNCSCTRGSISAEEVKTLKAKYLSKNFESMDPQGVRVKFSDCLDLCKDDGHIDTSKA